MAQFKKQAAALVAALAVSSTGVAEQQEQGFYISPMVGYYFFDNDRDYDDGGAVSLGLGYRYTESPWAAELTALRLETDVASTGQDADLTQLRLDGLYHFDSEGWSPYAAFGVGNASLDFADNDNEGLFVNAGGGVKLPVNDQLALRFDVRAVTDVDDINIDVIASAGFAFHFGAAKPMPKPAPRPAPAPQPEPPIDADRDGVIDSRDDCLNTMYGVKVDAKGCPLMVTETVEIELFVQFDTDKSVVKPEYFAEVKRLADFMKQYPETTVVVEGHTDSRGDADYNKGLSARRAAAVAFVLTDEYGINADRVKSVGYGEERPRAANDTPANMALNRRVVGVISTEVTRPAQ